MNTQYMIVLFCLLLTSCSARQEVPTDEAVRSWKLVNEKLLTLRKEGKTQEALTVSRKELPRLIKEIGKTEPHDSLLFQARLMADVCYDSYMNTRQYRAGLAFMDSIGTDTLWQKYFPYESLHYQSTFHQMLGDNEKAIHLANKYLSLPRNPDRSRFIQQAEAISGVYMYCGNDVPKAIELLEQAIEAYEAGGRFRNMVRVISRLGIY